MEYWLISTMPIIIFLKGHSNYLDQYKDLIWEQLPEVLPIVPEYGALELKTHPEHGEQMDRDFCADQSFSGTVHFIRE